MILILIVMEDALVLLFQHLNSHTVTSLNPCCNGRRSRTLQIYWQFRKNSVLILVVVDYGLVQNKAIMYQLTTPES